MSEIKAIIFDVGGVMTHGSFSQAFAETLSKQYGLDAAVVRQVFVDNEAAYLEGTESQHDVFTRVAKLLGIELDLNALSRLFEESIHVNTETVQIIKQLHGQYDLLIASDNYNEMVGHLKRELELEKYFSTMVFSNELHRRKVSKEFFAPILAKYEPSECIFIDDKTPNIVLGQEIGFTSILFTTAGALRQSLQELGLALSE